LEQISTRKYTSFGNDGKKKKRRTASATNESQWRRECHGRGPMVPWPDVLSFGVLEVLTIEISRLCIAWVWIEGLGPVLADPIKKIAHEKRRQQTFCQRQQRRFILDATAAVDNA
jgi:hypothetical protein